jgi:hypothetical protein
VRYRLQQDFGIAPAPLRAQLRFYLERYPIRIEVN